mgnify:CR=1 FL=1
MKYLLTAIVLAASLAPQVAIANPAYLDSSLVNRKISFVVPSPHTTYRLISGSSQSFTRSANECGQITIPDSTDFRIGSTVYDARTMPQEDPPRCRDGQLTRISGPVITPDRKIVIPGFPPYSIHRIESDSFRQTSAKKSNACGVVSFTESPNLQFVGFMNLWAADFSWGITNVLNGAINGSGPICRNGLLYSPR